MRNTLALGLFYSLAASTVCAEVAAQPSVLTAETQTPAPVPESSFALLVGGALWFLLLRKRA